MNLHFIELPVLLKFNIVPAFHIVAGPSFSYLVGGKDKFDGEGTVFGIDIDAEGEQELDMDDFNRRSEEHTSELQSLMRISYAVFCLKKKRTKNKHGLKH